MTAISVPQIGVHKPSRRSIPAAAPIACGKNKAPGEGSLRCPNPEQNRNAAVTIRCRRRPLPGQLFRNVEKRRCKNTPCLHLRVFATSSKRPNEGLHLRLLGEPQLDNFSLQPDCESMGFAWGFERILAT